MENFNRRFNSGNNTMPSFTPLGDFDLDSLFMGPDQGAQPFPTPSSSFSASSLPQRYAGNTSLQLSQQYADSFSFNPSQQLGFAGSTIDPALLQPNAMAHNEVPSNTSGGETLDIGLEAAIDWSLSTSTNQTGFNTASSGSQMEFGLHHPVPVRPMQRIGQWQQPQSLPQRPQQPMQRMQPSLPTYPPVQYPLYASSPAFTLAPTPQAAVAATPHFNQLPSSNFVAPSTFEAAPTPTQQQQQQQQQQPSPENWFPANAQSKYGYALYFETTEALQAGFADCPTSWEMSRRNWDGPWGITTRQVKGAAKGVIHWCASALTAGRIARAGIKEGEATTLNSLDYKEKAAFRKEAKLTAAAARAAKQATAGVSKRGRRPSAEAAAARARMANLERGAVATLSAVQEAPEEQPEEPTGELEQVRADGAAANEDEDDEYLRTALTSYNASNEPTPPVETSSSTPQEEQPRDSAEALPATSTATSTPATSVSQEEPAPANPSTAAPAPVASPATVQKSASEVMRRMRENGTALRRQEEERVREEERQAWEEEQRVREENEARAHAEAEEEQHACAAQLVPEEEEDELDNELFGNYGSDDADGEESVA